jgi:hypothetical protein
MKFLLFFAINPTLCMVGNWQSCPECSRSSTRRPNSLTQQLLIFLPTFFLPIRVCDDGEVVEWKVFESGLQLIERIIAEEWAAVLEMGYYV